MNAGLEKKEGVSIIKLEGDVRVRNIVELKNRFEEVVSESPSGVALNFSGVTHIDSSGIGLLLNFQKRLKAVSSDVCVYKLSEDIRGILEIAGIDEVIKIYDNEDEAVSSFQQ